MAEYWKSLDERKGGSPGAAAASDARAIVESLDSRPDRRDFLRAAGFALAGTAAACTRAPVEQAIPYLVAPEEVTPGRAYYYASTCGACPAGCGLLVKNRDGRPIKLEGLPGHPVNRGGLCASGQASLLGLYDRLRFAGPRLGREPAAWAEVDAAIRTRLAALRTGGGAVRVLTGTVTSPTLQAALDRFVAGFPDGRHVGYDAVSSWAILEAHAVTHGRRALPRYHFERAEVIVAFDADFLGTWISPVEFTAGYRAGRTLEGTPPRCSWHAQIEPVLSLTGSKADERIVVAPDELPGLVTALADVLGVTGAAGATGAPGATGATGATGASASSAVNATGRREAIVERLAARLLAAPGRGLVVCGSQDPAVQVQCNRINQHLGHYGRTLDLARPSRQRTGDDRALQGLVDELRAGRVDALFVAGVNPAYDLAGVEGLPEALAAVPLLVSLAEREDETSALAGFVCPDRHFLEAWSDAEPVAGVLTVSQPVVPALGDTRPVLESLLAWTGAGGTAYDAIRERWRTEVFPRSLGPVTSDRPAPEPDEEEEDEDAAGEAFRDFWDHAVHDGFVEMPAAEAPWLSALDSRLSQEPSAQRPEPSAQRPGPSAVDGPAPPQRPAPSPQSLVLVAYPTIALGDGRHAYNAWLQELPDPIGKVTWDNYACLAPATARRLGLRDGDEVRLTDARARAIELPVLLQPGQHETVVAVALGYGGLVTERFARTGPQWLQARPTVGPDGRVGAQVTRLLTFDDPDAPAAPPVTLERTGRRRTLASTQDYHSITVPAHMAPPGAAARPIVQETTLAAYAQDPGAGAPASSPPPAADLWPPDHTYPGARWGMAIDLNACTGCSACVIACQAENNIPVVGRDEVARHREMHWIRIDRYYAGAEDQVDVVHQPMLCQHCGNAPCEVVCPVLATVHSEEGLNQQIYNRCVGTRYCANNCPYKVRRFNWFDYPREDRIENLVLNPDVTVRSRGVMEKCTLCVQRIQEGKIEARRLGVPVADGTVQTACQQSCPARAITFGDLNDPESAVARLAASPRHFRVLEELNVKPGVGYLRLVRHRDGGGGPA